MNADVDKNATEIYETYFEHLPFLSDRIESIVSWTNAIKRFCNHHTGQGKFFKNDSFPLKERWDIQLFMMHEAEMVDIYCMMFPKRLMQLLNYGRKLD